MGIRAREYLLLSALFGLGAGETAAQGLLVFNNRVLNEVVAPVYDVEPSDPTLAKHGNTQVYTGARLAGAGFTAQLFGGPTNAAVESLVALSPATVFRTGEAAGFIVPPNTAVAVPGVPEGARAKVQLRAWNNRDGSISNWAQVLVDRAVARGESLPIITQPLGSVFTAPPNLEGLESFNLVLRIALSGLRRRPEGQFQFKYINPTGLTYCVEASEDLRQWTAIGGLAPGSGTFVDAAAANHERRFYRILPCQTP